MDGSDVAASGTETTDESIATRVPHDASPGDGHEHGVGATGARPQAASTTCPTRPHFDHSLRIMSVGGLHRAHNLIKPPRAKGRQRGLHRHYALASSLGTVLPDTMKLRI